LEAKQGVPARLLLAAHAEHADMKALARQTGKSVYKTCVLTAQTAKSAREAQLQHIVEQASVRPPNVTATLPSPQVRWSSPY